MPKGVFQTDRMIFDNPIWNQPAKFRLFFFIYGNAVFAEDGIDMSGIHIPRGSYLRSYRNLVSDLEYIENHAVKRYSVSNIKVLIDELVIEKRLEIKSTKLGTLFTVLNYEQYQGFTRFVKVNREQRKNSARTTKEQRENNNNNVNNVNNVNPSSKTKFSDDDAPLILEKESTKEKIPYPEIIEYLNQQIGTKYRADTTGTRALIKARWGEKFNLDDFKTVIDKKKAGWLNTEMEKFLRPSTLFGKKFEGYLNEKIFTQRAGKPNEDEPQKVWD